MIYRENTDKNFTKISNELLQNTNISYRARGIACYLLSKSEDWETTLADLKNNSPKEGRDAVRSALRELEEEGFAALNNTRDVNSGELKGKRWFVSGNKEWVTKIASRPSVYVVQEGKRWVMADTDRLETRPTETRPDGNPTVGDSNTTKRKNIQKKELTKERTTSSSTKQERPYLSLTSDEWRAASWWKRILEKNKLVPSSVTRTGGVTQKVLEQWSETLNKLHRIDGWSYQEIGQVLKWLNDTMHDVGHDGKPEHGNFWFSMSKFWSLNKLRKKTRDGEKTIFGAMYDAMQASKKKKKPATDNFTRG